MAIYTFGNAITSVNGYFTGQPNYYSAYVYKAQAPYNGEVTKITVYTKPAGVSNDAFYACIWNSSGTFLGKKQSNEIEVGDLDWHVCTFVTPISVVGGDYYYIGMLDRFGGMLAYYTAGSALGGVDTNHPSLGGTLDNLTLLDRHHCVYATMEAGPGSIIKRRGILHADLKKFRGVDIGDIMKFRNLT